MDEQSLLFSNKDLKKLIIPLIFEQALAMSVGMADTMMISSVGEAAISGVSLVDMFNYLIISVLAALATGGAVVTSQFIGARKQEEALKSAKQLLVTATVITTVLSVLVVIFNEGILNLFYGNIEADVFYNAQIYMLISTVSFPFLAVYNACAALFRSMGNSKITLKVSIVMNLINVAGNAVCIYILKMGVAGVAIPSLVSRMFAGVALYILLKNPVHMIHLDKTPYRFEWSIVKKILFIGIPGGLENGIFQLGKVIVISIIAGFGTVQIAANGVANSLDSLGCIVGQAMNLTMITVIGRCVGAGDLEQVKYFTKKLLKITYLYGGILNAAILLSLPWTLQLYGLSAETTRLSFILVMIHDGLSIILWPLAFTLPNMLRACNDVKYTMISSVISMIVFRVGFSIYFGEYLGYGAIGVWIAMILDWLVRITCFLVRYYTGKWKNLAIR